MTIVECDFVHQAVCAHNSIVHISVSKMLDCFPRKLKWTKWSVTGQLAFQFAIVYMYVLWVTYASLRAHTGKNTLPYVYLWSNPNLVSTFLTRDPILTLQFLGTLETFLFLELVFWSSLLYCILDTEKPDYCTKWNFIFPAQNICEHSG